MWGAFRIGVALLTIQMGPQLLSQPAHDDGTTLVVRFPDGKKTTVPIAGTAVAPMVKGSAEIEYRGGRSRIKLAIDKLPDPRQVGIFNTTYVAWIVRGDEKVESLTEVPLKKQDVMGSTAARTLGLIITAEPYGSVRLPSSVVVAELTLPQHSNGQLQSSTVNYERVPNDLYQTGLSDGSAPSPDSVTPLSVLGARRSVAIARKVEADQYAQAAEGGHQLARFAGAHLDQEAQGYEEVLRAGA